MTTRHHGSLLRPVAAYYTLFLIRLHSVLDLPHAFEGVEVLGSVHLYHLSLRCQFSFFHRSLSSPGVFSGPFRVLQHNQLGVYSFLVGLEFDLIWQNRGVHRMHKYHVLRPSLYSLVFSIAGWIGAQKECGVHSGQH